MNVIPVGDKEFLLTVTAGDAVHLSRETGPDETGGGAVPGWRLRPRRANARGRWRACNRAALAEPRWAKTTLCGRQWIAMANSDDGDAVDPGGEAFAPTCRRCLAIMDKLFPEPVIDDRLALIVQTITDTIAEHGYAEMRNVRGDQQATLRKQVRSALRQRTGYGLQALVHKSMVVFICEPAGSRSATSKTASSPAAARRPRASPRPRRPATCSPPCSTRRATGRPGPWPPAPPPGTRREQGRTRAVRDRPQVWPPPPGGAAAPLIDPAARTRNAPCPRG